MNQEEQNNFYPDWGITEFAETLGLSPQTVRRLIKNKIIKAARFGRGKYRIPYEEVLRLKTQAFE